MWQRQRHHGASIAGTRWAASWRCAGAGLARAAWQPAAEAGFRRAMHAGTRLGRRTGPTPTTRYRHCSIVGEHLGKNGNG